MHNYRRYRSLASIVIFAFGTSLGGASALFSQEEAILQAIAAAEQTGAPILAIAGRET